MKKIISLIIVFSVICSLCAGIIPVSAEEGLSWDIRESKYKDTETEWKFRPVKDRVSMQNPPDFSWPWVDIATSYDLKVCKDKALTDIVYEKTGITNNFYNFNHTFEPGIYYWSVRFNSPKGQSVWTEASRFLLSSDAEPFIVPEFSEILDKIPTSHPKMLGDIEELKDLALNDADGSRFYEQIKTAAVAHKNSPIPEEPIYDSKNADALRGSSQGMMNLFIRCGLVYNIENDIEMGLFAKDVLMEMVSWDPHGNTSYDKQNQAFREFLVAAYTGYDFLYNLLSEEEKEKVLEHIKIRGNIQACPTIGLQDSPDKLIYSPYMSHGWSAIMYMIEAGLITYGELPDAEEWLRTFLSLYINLSPPWGGEDGAWAQGSGYGSTFVTRGEDIRWLLKYNGILSMNDKAFYRNYWKYALYTFGISTGAEFGDQSYGLFDAAWAYNAKYAAYWYDNPYSMWQFEKYGAAASGAINLIRMLTNEKPDAKAPIDLPNSIVFRDTGLVAMHSTIEDLSGRISCYFKSSPYGSYNHSHPDQNSFIISAYNERLAIDSGYYDTYAGEFDLNYYKRTHAHNTITYDNGKGQPANEMKAKGNIVNFITHPSFDLTTGDASGAYDFKLKANGYTESEQDNIDKARRHMIYVRPDTFIVIDDLKAAGDKEVTFEWWLNAYDDISLYNDNSGARIVKGKAALDAKVHYPKKVTAKYSDIFSGTDLVSRTPAKYASDQIHKRVWFATPKSNQTKIITTLSVHKSDEESQYVKEEIIGNVTKLGFEDGTVAYIKNDSSQFFEIAGYKTDADAIVIKKDTVMMVDGTYLYVNGEEKFSSDIRFSVILGADELSVSCINDANIKINTKDIYKLRNEKGVEFPQNDSTKGFNWSNENGYLTAKVYNGFYTFYINEKPLPGSPAEGTMVSICVNGDKRDVKATGYYDHSGKKMISAEMFNNMDFYNVDDINNVNIKNGAKKGDVVLLNPGEAIYPTGDNPYVSVSTLSANGDVPNEKTSDYDALKAKCDIVTEAESFDSKEGRAKIYTTRTFLSGAAGISEFNNFGDSATWKIEVPESGYYDLVIKYVGWGSDVIERLFKINDSYGSLALPATGTYGQLPTEWIATRNFTKVYLEKGTNTLTLYPKTGNWNFDWFGFIKSDKK